MATLRVDRDAFEKERQVVKESGACALTTALRPAE